MIVSKRIPDRVGDGVAEPRIWLLARSLIMPSEAVVVRAPEQHPNTMASSKRNRYLPTYIARMSGTVVTTTPHRNRLEAERLQSSNKARSGRDTHHGDEDVEADRIHEPDGGGGYPAEGRTHRAQPAEEEPGNQGPAGGGERQRNAADLVNNGAEQGADGDCRANERHIRHIGRSVWVTQHFGGGRDVLRPPDDGHDIAAVQLGVGQDRNIRGGRPARDLCAGRRRAPPAISPTRLGSCRRRPCW